MADLSLWHKVGLSIGLALFGLSKVWQNDHLATLAVLFIFAPRVPQMIRNYREF
jgi:hypothetical protein